MDLSILPPGCRRPDIKRVSSKTISRVMSLDNHLSRHGVAAVLKRPTWSVTGRHTASFRSCFGWGLHVPSLLPARR